MIQDLKKKEYTKRNIYKCFLGHARALLSLSPQKGFYLFWNTSKKVYVILNLFQDLKKEEEKEAKEIKRWKTQV